MLTLARWVAKYVLVGSELSRERISGTLVTFGAGILLLSLQALSEPIAESSIRPKITFFIN